MKDHCVTLPSQGGSLAIWTLSSTALPYNHNDKALKFTPSKNSEI